MSDQPSVTDVEKGDEFIHVRFRDPDLFKEIRTPDWASRAARSISEGAEVRTGERKDSDEWTVQSVLVEKTVGRDKAVEQAKTILNEIES